MRLIKLRLTAGIIRMTRNLDYLVCEREKTLTIHKTGDLYVIRWPQQVSSGPSKQVAANTA